MLSPAYVSVQLLCTVHHTHAKRGCGQHLRMWLMLHCTLSAAELFGSKPVFSQWRITEFRVKGNINHWALTLVDREKRRTLSLFPLQCSSSRCKTWARSRDTYEIHMGTDLSRFTPTCKQHHFYERENQTFNVTKEITKLFGSFN